MRNHRALVLAAVVLALGLAWVHTTPGVGPAGAADPGSLPGTATLSGGVDAPKPFKAAQVHLMNVDKNVLFMVYTSGGRYRAVNLFPGRYEVTVQKPGFATDMRTVVLAAGAGQTLDFSLREQAAQPVRQGEFGFTTRSASDV